MATSISNNTTSTIGTANNPTTLPTVVVTSPPKTPDSTASTSSSPNIASLLNPSTLSTLASIRDPKAFGDQVKDLAKQQITKAITESTLAKLLRIKANFSAKTNELVEYGHHIDYKNCMTSIFYVNSNDGYTIFKKNKKIIKSEENKFISFKSNLEHAGTTCTDENCRIVINFNYF
jgi:hypothetical protein